MAIHVNMGVGREVPGVVAVLREGHKFISHR